MCIPDAGKDWRQEEKGTTEDEAVGWHHQLNAHEFEQTLGDGEGQGSLVCCSPWGHKESDTSDCKQQQSICHNLFIRSCIRGSLACFYVLAVVNSVVMIVRVQIYFRYAVFISFGHTVIPLYPQVQHLWIQSTVDWKYPGKNNSEKFQKAKLEFAAWQQLFT